MFGFLEGMVTLLTSADPISPANRQLPSGDLISLYYVFWIIWGFVTTDLDFGCKWQPRSQTGGIFVIKLYVASQ